ncbi:MAG: beta-lactamase family protein [Clostridiales bacterium]|nr:beta-lactamase family protein [Clostridiales bacterium]
MGFKPLMRSTPFEQGVAPSAIEDLEAAFWRSKAQMRGFILLRHGKVIAEKYWNPYKANDKVWVYSISKSFTSTAIGLAVGEGKISLNDKAASFFPDRLPEAVSDNLRNMSIHDLLSMACGHEYDSAPYIFNAPEGDWIKSFMSLPVPYEPGSHFIYDSGASFILSAIVQKATGGKLLDYLKPRLFDKLGFDEAMWDESPEGISTGGWGIMVRLEDLAKLGQLYLNKGKYAGESILSEEWVDAATRKQTDNDGENPDWSQGYGYQFWRCRHNAYRADGAYGQYCIVMPDQDAVLAVMSETRDMQELLDIVWDVLLPAFDGAQSPIEKKLNAKAYRLEENPYGLSSASFFFGDASATVSLHGKESSYTVSAGRTNWLDWHIPPTLAFWSLTPVFGLKDEVSKASARFVWTSESELEMFWVYRSMPHRGKLKVIFSDGSIEMVWPANEIAESVGGADIRICGRLG